MRIRVIAVLMGLTVVAGACSSSDDSGATEAEPDPAVTTSAAVEGTVAPAESTTTTAAEPGASGGGDGTATVTLENGEAFTFSILCSLEPQEAAGSEILFTAVSYDKPHNFDVTQFGTGGVVNDQGSIDIYDASTYDTVWGAGTTMAQLSNSDFELALNGTTITGSGLFFSGEDVDNLNLDNGVPGELVADCG